jgi:hypothetical protein
VLYNTSVQRNHWQAAALVAVWMGLGWLLHLDPNQYLFLGVPLAAGFQLFVRRQPLVRLWVRDASSFSLTRSTVVLALVLMVLPAYELVRALRAREWESAIWMACCLAGAVCAAFAFGRLRREAISRTVVLSCLAAVLFHGALLAVTALATKHSPLLPGDKVLPLLKDWYLYFLVCFVLEEVAFRGAVDSHVYSDGDTTAKPWASAVFVAALWGLWHLPALPIDSLIALPVLALTLIVIHLFSGVALSFCWRAGGTLIFPAAVHALIDAYRNAIMQ